MLILLWDMLLLNRSIKSIAGTIGPRRRTLRLRPTSDQGHCGLPDAVLNPDSRQHTSSEALQPTSCHPTQDQVKLMARICDTAGKARRLSLQSLERVHTKLHMYTHAEHELTATPEAKCLWQYRKQPSIQSPSSVSLRTIICFIVHLRGSLPI